jgi:hypothetical protein
MVMNGGTTNNNPNKLGTLNMHLATLKEAGIKVGEFYEPDLNDALTAVTFLADERVFNREKYPDLNYKSPHRLPDDMIGFSVYRMNQITNDEDHAKKQWIKSIGGEQNAFLRAFLFTGNNGKSFQFA